MQENFPVPEIEDTWIRGPHDEKDETVCVFLHLGMDLQFMWKGGKGS